MSDQAIGVRMMSEETNPSWEPSPAKTADVCPLSIGFSSLMFGAESAIAKT